MPRLLLLLIMLAFVATNGVGAPLALCQHADARAHAAALAGGDPAAAAQAKSEESAEAAEKQGLLAEAAAPALAGFLPPAAPSLPLPAASESIAGRATDDPGLASRAIPPLLDPPLA